MRPLSATLALLAFLAVGSPLYAQRAGERLFYAVDTEESWQSFRRDVGRIDVAAPGICKVDGQGVVWGEPDARMPRLARDEDPEIWDALGTPR